MSLKFVRQRDGSRLLAHANISGRTLKAFMVGPAQRAEAPFIMQDCSLQDCNITGPFCFFEGSVVRDVTFENVKCSDVLTISTCCVLERVAVKGEFPKGIWVKPEDGLSQKLSEEFNLWSEREMSSVTSGLDVSSFAGDVEILGSIHVSRALYDPKRHIRVSTQIDGLPEFRKLKVSGSNFWRRRIANLRIRGLSEGLFSLTSCDEDSSTIAQLKEIHAFGL